MPAWRARPVFRLGLLAFLGLAFLQAPNTGSAQTIDLVDRSSLRVCADPANLPFSNEKGEGFENRLAELIAEKLSVPVLYTWFPQVTGFIRNTLRAHKCDLVMGYAQGHELVQNTNHYYRSAYALLYRADSGLDGVESLDDPRLKDKRIGIIAGTPPATIMALNGLIGKAKPYPLVVDRRFSGAIGVARNSDRSYGGGDGQRQQPVGRGEGLPGSVGLVANERLHGLY